MEFYWMFMFYYKIDNEKKSISILILALGLI